MIKQFFLQESQNLAVILFIVNVRDKKIVCWLSPNTLTLNSSFIAEYLLCLVFPSSTLKTQLEAKILMLIYTISLKMLLLFRTWLANSLLGRVFY